jgi:hypothetical protein
MRIPTLALAWLLAASALQAQDGPPVPSQPEPEHIWLNQLAGTWTVESEFSMGPGTDPVKGQGEITTRIMGGLWAISEGSGTVPEMGTMHMLMVVGYEPAKKAFSGIWADSMHAHLWRYEGHLDAKRTTLNLEAEGPSMADPKKTARYRDAIEVAGPDHLILRSSVLGEDESWTQFGTMHYRRRK